MRQFIGGQLWNDCVVAVARLEDQIRSLCSEQPSAVSDDERMALMALAGDLPALWNDAAFARRAEGDYRHSRDRSAAPRAALAGGDHTRLEVLKNRSDQIATRRM